MTTPPSPQPWVNPRQSFDMISRFCDDLTEGVDGYVGACHKRQETDGAHPRSYRWVRPRRLAEEVRALHWSVCNEACDPYFQRYGLRSPPYPVETMVRLGACAEVPPNYGGAVEDLSMVMGLSVDIDVATYRDDGDIKNYCPTFDLAIAPVDDLAPTYLVHGGGGMPAVWLFTEPCRDIEAANALALDLRETICQRCAELGWDFDSPPPLTAWVKCPGSWSSKYGRVVEVIEEGDRWDFDALRHAIPTYRHRSSHGYEDTFTPVRRGRGTRRGQRS